MLAQVVDPKIIDAVVKPVERNPMIMPTIILGGMLIVMILGLVMAARKLGPWVERLATNLMAHMAQLLAARGAESERDMAQVTKQLGTEITAKIERIDAKVSDLHEDLATLAAKFAAAGLALLLLTGSVESSESAASVEAAAALDMAAPLPVLAQVVIKPPQEPAPPQDPMICNPRCPSGQQCSGSICTVRVRPKQPKRPRPVRKVAAAVPPAAGPTSYNIAGMTESWSDGVDPFDREPPEDYR